MSFRSNRWRGWVYSHEKREAHELMVAEVERLRAENTELPQYVSALHSNGWTLTLQAELDWFRRREPLLLDVRARYEAEEADGEWADFNGWEMSNAKHGAST